MRLRKQNHSSATNLGQEAAYLHIGGQERRRDDARRDAPYETTRRPALRTALTRLKSPPLDGARVSHHEQRTTTTRSWSQGQGASRPCSIYSSSARHGRHATSACRLAFETILSSPDFKKDVKTRKKETQWMNGPFELFYPMLYCFSSWERIKEW